MKQVSSQKYDVQYWDNFPFSYNRKIKLEEYGDVPNRISKLLRLKKTDTVVDLGCGTGLVTFFLLQKYNCKVIGIDYSKDAIKICKYNKKKFLENNRINSTKITFLNKTISELATFKDIKAVYLKDVIEHLYDEEINKILGKIKKWNKKTIYLAIHTDNNLYLRYVRPFEDLINLLLHKTTRKKIKKRNKYEAERHVNLMTANQLKSKLLRQGFVIYKVEYATLNYKKIREQLRIISQLKPLLLIIYFFAKILFFLRPSFYVLAKFKKTENLKK